MTENTPPSLSVDPLVKDLNQSVVELRIELDELREKISRLESEQKMVTALRTVIAHIDAQPHEPSLKGVLTSARRRIGKATLNLFLVSLNTASQQRRPVLASRAARAWRAEMLGLPLALASRPSNRNRNSIPRLIGHGRKTTDRREQQQAQG